MGAPKGNQYAKGNRGGGDKPDSVKFAAFINSAMANEIGNEELKRIKSEKKRKREDLKEIVMPIVLKGMTEKIDMTTKGKSINYEEEQRRKIANRIIGRESDTGGSGEKLPD